MLLKGAMLHCSTDPGSLELSMNLSSHERPQKTPSFHFSTLPVLFLKKGFSCPGDLVVVKNLGRMNFYIT